MRLESFFGRYVAREDIETHAHIDKRSFLSPPHGDQIAEATCSKRRLVCQDGTAENIIDEM